MNAIKSINKALAGLTESHRNPAGSIFLNAVKNEFIRFNAEIQIPGIPVKELYYDLAFNIIKEIIKYIPEFLQGHTLLEKRKPASEQHSLHFIKHLKGTLLDFIHILKIDLKFSGDSDNITEKGDSNNYPAYKTDRFYYKSRLIPVISIKKNRYIEDFSSAKLFDITYIESDKRFFTSVIFDDIDTGRISGEIKTKIDPGIFRISQDLYPFIVYDYNTACLNILYPEKNEIEKSVLLFEPVFLSLYSKYKDINELIKISNILNTFDDSLKGNKTLNLKKPHIEKLSKYFSRFSTHRDDDLMLKSWWKINIEK
ncbi:MAG: hypothetical protein JW864_04240 [Spirochaetes bacterium]|nr:hypothetical protein [Spirochaetota bacterium]